MTLNRRDFIKLGVGTSLVYLTLSPWARAALRPTHAAASEADPLRSFTGEFSNSAFNGDDPKRAHDRLWDLEGYLRSKGGRPKDIFERRKVVIVGGGIAGLTSAYLLRDFAPLLLEQETQFGGQSKGEIYGETAFSMGAAYIGVPDPGGAIESMLSEIRVLEQGRLETPSESLSYLKDRGFVSLWGGEDDSELAKKARHFTRVLEKIRDQYYPEVPFREGSLSRADWEKFDRSSFWDWLQQQFGTLPEILLESLQLYCWSSFGASLQEVSAAQALNFLAAETKGIMAFPGGNARISQGLYDFLRKALPPNSLRNRNFVLEVLPRENGVEILLEDEQGILRRIFCEACVLSCPKYLVPALVRNLEPEKKNLARSLESRAFVVSNFLLDRALPSPGFDVFRLEGRLPSLPETQHPPTRPFADFCFANWAQVDSKQSVLTVYKPFPYQGARAHLFSPSAFERCKQEVTQGLHEILSTLGVSANSIRGVRQTLWGHALPLASPGFLADRNDEVFARPTAGRVFYANCDQLANPSFESSFAVAEQAAQGLRRLL